MTSSLKEKSKFVSQSSSDIEIPYGFWYLGQEGQSLWLMKHNPFRGLEMSEVMFGQRDQDLKEDQSGDDLNEKRWRRKYSLLKRQPQPQPWFPESGNNKILPFPRLG